MNVHISEEARRFVAAEVASGRYASEDAVIEDALRRMRQQEQPSPVGRSLDNDPLWGMFRDEPELMDQIVQDTMRDRYTIPWRATGDE
jgi:putative addiction module CopG family antidote